MCDPRGFLGGSDDKEPACNAEDAGSIPGSGRSPGEGNGNPFQYSCLENPTDRGTWWGAVHGFSKELDTTERLTHLWSPALFLAPELLRTLEFPRW